MDTSNFPSNSIQIIRELCLRDLLPKERLQSMANPSIELLLAWHNPTQRNNHKQ